MTQLSLLTRRALSFLVDYFGFTQFTPAIFVQGISVLIIFVWITVLSSHTPTSQTLYQSIFSFLGLSSLHISSNNPIFWTTILRTYLIASFVFQITTYGVNALRRTRLNPFSTLSLIGLYCVLPTITLALGAIVLAVEPLAAGNTYLSTLGALFTMYLFAIITVVYGVVVRSFCIKLSSTLTSIKTT
jgi:hypothetical protein